MGVPFYFKKIFNNYPEIISNKYDATTSPYLLLDFNGIIHQCSNKIISDNINFKEEDIFIEIKRYLFELKERFKPELIYVAIDGVAPLSKIKQQRQRRFKTMFYQQQKQKILQKYKQDTPKWNSNCITPGTPFMNRLNCFLKTISIENLIISDSDEKGEGEHKMFNFIKNNEIVGDIIIHGLDADLIFLSLLSNFKKIKIFRDNHDEESFLNIDILKKYLISDFKLNINYPISDDFRLIQDYIAICFLLGNDFLPKISSLDIISNNGLNVVEEIYLQILNTKKQHLIGEQNYSINIEFFKTLIAELSKVEQNSLNKANYKYVEKKFYNKNHSEGMELEINKLEFLPLFKKTYINYNNIFDWKHEYYSHYFKNLDDKTKVVEQYLIGIQWIFSYYINGKSPNNWYYPYLNSPLLEDINNYFNSNNNLPVYTELYPIEITPVIQLLLVLPKSSHNLLPDKFRNVYNSHLQFLYPTDFFIDTHLNTYLHQCIPFIPNFNILDVYNYFSTK